MKKIFATIVVMVLVGFNLVHAEGQLISIDLLLRSGNTVVYDDTLEFVDTGLIEISDNNGNIHNLDSRSVLAALYKLDQENDSFEISNLEYYEAFGSFYLKCMVLSGEEYCDDWQFAVDGSNPWTGIDQTILSGGEEVGVYLSPNHKLDLSTNQIVEGNSVIIRAKKYNYLNNTWEDLPGFTISVAIPNPDAPWSPSVLYDQSVDNVGKMVAVFNDAGKYIVGIKEDYMYPSYEITVLPLPTQPHSGGGSTPVINNSSNDKVETGTNEQKKFDVEKAIEFLKKIESENPDLLGEMYLDWTAIAYSGYGTDTKKIKNYLKEKSVVNDLLTDNERRVMSLLSLNIDPYEFNKENYIESIVGSFDGEQFGDKNLVNDDVFALIPLFNSGYTTEDNIIKKSASYILSKQSNDGSWNGSVDLTAGAIVALSHFSNVEIENSIMKAKEYLINKQKEDGSWENSVFSTSWVMMAMKTLAENWSRNGFTAENYLANEQSEDGGLLEGDSLQKRIWATAYAIPASLGKSWGEIMYNVKKPNTVLDLAKKMIPMNSGISSGDTALGGDPRKDYIDSTGEDLLVEENSMNLNAQAVRSFNLLNIDNITYIVIVLSIFFGYLFFKEFYQKK